MTENQVLTALWTGAYLLIQLGVIARAILRPHREPASRVAWVVVIVVLPVVGIIAYILLGETNIGRRRVSRMCAVLAAMPDVAKAPGMDAPNLQPKIPEPYAHLFRLGHSVNGFEPVGGNSARLLPDSNATIASMVADIDAAQDHVHLTVYIWLPDNNGLKVVEALKRAAARKVICRTMADGLGSRSMIASEHWKAMQEAGVQVATALAIGDPLLRPLRGRIDLRNHRKILVIDNRITYCGSQNCADPELDRKSTRLNSSHSQISYAVLCLKKKTQLQISSARMKRYRVFPAEINHRGARILRARQTGSPRSSHCTTTVLMMASGSTWSFTCE